MAAHEFGHSLGLSHSDVRSALMAPFYRGYDPSLSLDTDDIEGIQVITAPLFSYLFVSGKNYNNHRMDVCNESVSIEVAIIGDERSGVERMGEEYVSKQKSRNCTQLPQEIQSRRLMLHGSARFGGLSLLFFVLLADPCEPYFRHVPASGQDGTGLAACASQPSLTPEPDTRQGIWQQGR